MAISVHMIDRGIATEMISVDSTLRRKIRMTRNASAAPWTDSCQRLSIDWRMYVDWSKISPIFTPGGTRSSFGRMARTPSTTSIVFAAGCLLTRRYTARSPSTRTMLVCCSDESSTYPRSRTRTGTSPTLRTTMSSMGLTSWN